MHFRENQYKLVPYVTPFPSEYFQAQTTSKQQHALHAPAKQLFAACQRRMTAQQ